VSQAEIGAVGRREPGTTLKLLFLCKRRPQGRDLMQAPYGRFFHLPRLLAERGHEVAVALLSYRGLPAAAHDRDGVAWTSDDLMPRGALPYLRRVRAIAERQRPDWIVGASDTYFGILAVRTARHCGARAAVDAYDNFESYLPWAWPLHAWWRRALRNADLVTAAGPQLAARLAASGTRAAVRVLPMAADPSFRPLDRGQCRRHLGLDPQARYIGVAGSLDGRRGAPVLLDALERLRRGGRDVTLLLSGRGAARFQGLPGVRTLGLLADADVPVFINSLDVACVIAADNAFGRYSYPAKLCEALACGVPVVASATDPVRWMLGGDARFLVPVGDADALAQRIAGNLALGRVTYPEGGGWTERAAALETWLSEPA
jgi:glycosyltransferase involved in cell wall biosynthesis